MDDNLRDFTNSVKECSLLMNRVKTDYRHEFNEYCTIVSDLETSNLEKFSELQSKILEFRLSNENIDLTPLVNDVLSKMANVKEIAQVDRDRAIDGSKCGPEKFIRMHDNIELVRDNIENIIKSNDEDGDKLYNIVRFLVGKIVLF